MGPLLGRVVAVALAVAVLGIVMPLLGKVVGQGCDGERSCSVKGKTKAIIGRDSAMIDKSRGKTTVVQNEASAVRFSVWVKPVVWWLIHRYLQQHVICGVAR